MLTNTFKATLVRKGQLMTSQKGVDFMFLTLARNYSKRLEDGSYKELGTIYQSATAFGATARALADSDIETGFTMLVTGTLQGNVKSAYTDKNGVEHPESFEETINIESIGVALERGQTVVASRQKSNKKENENKQTDSKLSQSKEAPKTSNTDFDNMFGDSDDSLFDDDDLFA